MKRKEEVIANPDASFRIQAGDVVVVLGDEAAVDAVVELLDPSTPVA